MTARGSALSCSCRVTTHDPLMTKMRVAIVDDEELARNILREYLSAWEDVDIVAECANGFEAVKAVSEVKPDLLLLDIQMPRLDGFEVLELVGHEVGVAVRLPGVGPAGPGDPRGRGRPGPALHGAGHRHQPRTREPAGASV